MGKEIAVLGFGVTGQSVTQHLLGCGFVPIVLDTRPSRPVGEEFRNVDIRWGIRSWPGLDVERVVVSPGLELTSCLVQGARKAGLELVSDIDIFFEQANAPVIGITGTNGKSTVTSLVGHLLEHADYEPGVGGNLGRAALDLLREEHDVYVLELSSFQLERSRIHHFDRATILNITEDHLDQHGDLPRYAEAKHRIFSDADIAVSNRDDDRTRCGGERMTIGLSEPSDDREWGIVELAGKPWIALGQEAIISTDALPLDGTHNQLNVMAACALVEGLISRSELVKSLVNFTGLPHRFQKVAESQGIVFIDDSKATNVGATLAALYGLPLQQEVVLIAGGDAKGADLNPLTEAFHSRVSAVVALGKDGPDIAAIASGLGIETRSSESMLEAVSLAMAMVEPGQWILLSPACASLDMFSSYIERGRQFREAAERLINLGKDEGVVR